jgi:hypothetical protein
MKNLNLDTLKTQFDKVCLKHVREEKSAITVAVLVKGNKAYVGASKCHEGDNFNREIGRNISLGRALSLAQDSTKKQSSTRFVLEVDNLDYDAVLNSSLETIEALTKTEIKNKHKEK